MSEQQSVPGQAPLESYPPQFREAVALARDLATGSLREQQAAGTIAAFMFRLMHAEPRAEAFATVIEVCAQANKDAQHNREQARHSRGHAERRAAAYCEGILRITGAVAVNAARVLNAAPKPPTSSPPTPSQSDRPATKANHPHPHNPVRTTGPTQHQE